MSTTITLTTTLGDDDRDLLGSDEDAIVKFWFGVVVPGGHMIAFLIVAYLLYTLVKTFKSKKATHVQISAVTVLIGYLIYNFFGIIKIALGLRECAVKSGIMQGSYFLTRAAVYYFFVIRCQTAFDGSKFAFNKRTIYCLLVFISILYAFTVIFFISTAGDNVFEEKREICVLGLRQDNPVRVIARYVIIAANIGDFFLGAITVGLYTKKLRQLHQMINELNDSANDSDSGINFYHVAKRSAKYAWVAWFSTLLTISGAMVSFLFFNLWLDSIITALCVYCSFKTDFSVKVQLYCCECCHNKWLLCVCSCCCCPCCNERYYCLREVGMAHIEKKLEVEVNARNDGKSSIPSSSPEASGDAVDSSDFMKSKTDAAVSMETTNEVSDPSAATITDATITTAP